MHRPCEGDNVVMILTDEKIIFSFILCPLMDTFGKFTIFIFKQNPFFPETFQPAARFKP